MKRQAVYEVILAFCIGFVRIKPTEEGASHHNRILPLHFGLAPGIFDRTPRIEDTDL
jgi:hypothetical protein